MTAHRGCGGMGQPAYDRLVERFKGQRPQIDCWSPTQYRVAYHGWHRHNGAAYGAPFADGKTLGAACEALLNQVDAPEAELVQGSCDQLCANRYNASSKAKLAHRRLMDFIQKTAAEVDRWPAWKRGLPPCPNDGCDRAVGHKCECG
jgi:hypothetical protein